ncbi:MAG: hypothetical protein V3R81_09275, partial [Gammaproteobacteria bacterium]
AGVAVVAGAACGAAAPPGRRVGARITLVLRCAAAAGVAVVARLTLVLRRAAAAGAAVVAGAAGRACAHIRLARRPVIRARVARGGDFAIAVGTRRAQDARRWIRDARREVVAAIARRALATTTATIDTGTI